VSQPPSREPFIEPLSNDRLRLSHGPIDVVLKAFGGRPNVARAYRAAAARFPKILPELCAELPRLRSAIGAAERPESPVGRRMFSACLPLAEDFVTPMAAVAGAVADELLAEMLAAAPLDKAYVNDGGDIAVHCFAGQSLDIAIAGDFSRDDVPRRSGTIGIRHSDGVGGIATSGARGRSFSLGIADSVTVLASNAAAADAAATLIANSVDLPHPGIVRCPAEDLDPDSDLGGRLVTVGVPRLAASDIAAALAAGLQRAEDYRRRGLIIDAALSLQGETVVLGSHGFALERILW
jgi:ApbE superfamily uncharacterized protein (UPF0280 family)